MRHFWALSLITGLFLSFSLRGDDTADFLKPENWKGLENFWTIDAKNRTIIGETKKDPKFNTFLVSQTPYGDFEMSFKVQLLDAQGNSGIQIRSAVIDEKKFVVAGPQCDIGQKFWGSLYGEKVGGMLQACPSDFVAKNVKPNDFNEYSIRVQGTHITVKVNGQVTVDGDFPKTKNGKALAEEGVVAFQLHQGFPKMKVTFKDISFKKLK